MLLITTPSHPTKTKSSLTFFKKLANSKTKSKSSSFSIKKNKSGIFTNYSKNNKMPLLSMTHKLTPKVNTILPLTMFTLGVESVKVFITVLTIVGAQKPKESKNLEIKKFKSYSAHKPSVEASISELSPWS